MTKQDYLTHLGLAIVFFATLGPFLLHHGISLGSGLYVVGTASQVVIASMIRLARQDL